MVLPTIQRVFILISDGILTYLDCTANLTLAPTYLVKYWISAMLPRQGVVLQSLVPHPDEATLLKSRIGVFYKVCWC